MSGKCQIILCNNDAKFYDNYVGKQVCWQCKNELNTLKNEGKWATIKKIWKNVREEENW